MKREPMISRKSRLLIIAFVLYGIIISNFYSCTKSGTYEAIEAPSSPILTEKYSWAVCNTTNMHMYTEPDKKSEILSTIWKASIVEILSRSPKSEVVNEKEQFWYRVRYNELEGWVFGSFLHFVPTYEKAIAVSRG
jgi:hypothetical protein